MSGGFDPAGFRDVDRAGDAAAFSANLDRATSVEAIARNRELVREALALGAGDHLLDVGCGNGEEGRAAAALVGTGRAVGLDMSEALVSEALRRTPAGTRNVEFVVGDAHALPFPDDSFDAVRTERVPGPARVRDNRCSNAVAVRNRLATAFARWRRVGLPE